MSHIPSYEEALEKRLYLLKTVKTYEIVYNTEETLSKTVELPSTPSNDSDSGSKIPNIPRLNKSNQPPSRQR